MKCHCIHIAKQILNIGHDIPDRQTHTCLLSSIWQVPYDHMHDGHSFSQHTLLEFNKCMNEQLPPTCIYGYFPPMTSLYFHHSMSHEESQTDHPNLSIISPAALHCSDELDNVCSQH